MLEFLPTLASGIGGILNYFTGRQNAAREDRMNMLNFQQQQQFARSGIQMRVADAKAAGIHPLYAVGANTPQYSPMSVAGQPGLGDTVKGMGQSLERAALATAGRDDRLGAFTQKMRDLQLERGSLENEKLRSEIAVNHGQIGPAMPRVGGSLRYGLEGQGNSLGSGPLVKSVPMEQTPSARGAANQEPGAVTDVGYARTKTGFAPVPSQDVKNRIEDQIIPELTWALRNQVLPSLGVRSDPPKVSPGEGRMWVYNPFMQEYVARPDNRVFRMLKGR